MSQLLIESFEVSNFRAFEKLQIAHLGRANLITGKNSVGKSSLLESLWLYANKGSPSTILDILSVRKEINTRVLPRPQAEVRPRDEEDLFEALKHLFYNRPKIEGSPVSIKIGPINSPQDKLSLTLDWYTLQNDREDTAVLWQPSFDNFANLADSVIALEIKFANQSQVVFTLDRFLNRYSRPASSSNNNLIRTAGVNEAFIADLWAKVVLTDSEDEIIKALRIISSEVERVAVVASDSRIENKNSIIVKMKNSDSPIPLRTLGDGISRVFGLILTLVNSKDGILLIDEFENGLHYTVMFELWKLILQVARRLNVQIFATTHSSDCIEAFQKATIEDRQEEGILLRLDKRDGLVVPILYDEHRLSIATREQIEVR